MRKEEPSTGAPIFEVLEEQRFAEAILCWGADETPTSSVWSIGWLADFYLRQLDVSVKEDQGFYEGYLQG